MLSKNWNKYMQTEKPSLIPEFYFSRNVTNDDRISFRDHISQFKYSDSPVQFIDFDRKIEELRQIIVGYFTDMLGIDVSERLLPRSKIHFMDPPLFSETKTRLAIPPDLRRAFYSNNVYQIFIRTTDKDGNLRPEGSLLRSLCHELIHSISYKLYDLKRLQNKKLFILIKDGFHDPQNAEFNYLKEALVEISVFIINKKYIRKFLSLAEAFEIGIRSESSGYMENVLILDSIMLQSEEKGLDTHDNLLKNIYSDYILGTHIGSDKIRLVLGNEKYELFKKLITERRNWDMIKDLARTLDLTVFLKRSEGIEKLDDYGFEKDFMLK
jgi:hypothetical protein